MPAVTIPTDSSQLQSLYLFGMLLVHEALRRVYKDQSPVFGSKSYTNALYSLISCNRVNLEMKVLAI